MATPNNVVNYATKYSREFDHMFRQNLVTAPLLRAANDERWINAQTVLISDLETQGLGSHDRGFGWNTREVKNNRTPYTLEMDRDAEFFVDKADVDESNQDLAAANVTKKFMENWVIPEVDAYRFSKLAKAAETRGAVKEETLTKDNVYQRLVEMTNKLRKYGSGNVIGYLDSETMNALEMSTYFGRNITVQNIAPGSALETRIASINGIQLVEVWDEGRMFDEFDFTTGFAPTESTKKINAMFVAKPVVIGTQKIESTYFFAPGQHTKGDGYLFQYRLYHDIFLLKNKKDAIAVSLEDGEAGA